MAIPASAGETFVVKITIKKEIITVIATTKRSSHTACLNIKNNLSSEVAKKRRNYL